MDELIETYITLTFHEEMQSLIHRAFSLFTNFNYPDFQLPYVNLLMTESTMLAEDIQDKFIHTVRDQIDYILNSHIIELTDTATISECIGVLDFLWHVQDLADYTQLQITLNSSKDRYECFALAIHDHTHLDVNRAMIILKNIDKLTFNTLKQYVDYKVKGKELQIPRYSKVGKEIIANMREFISFTKREDLLGAQLMDDNVILDQPIKIYHGYIKDFFNNDMSIENTAYHLLSLLYLLKEGIDRPIVAYRESVNLFFNDLDKISKIEYQLTNIHNEFVSFLKVKSDRVDVAYDSGMRAMNEGAEE